MYVPWFFVSSQQRFRATDIKALGASQLSGLGQTMLQLLGKSVLQLHFIYKIAGESKTWREESGGVRGEGGGWGRERKRERESARAHAHARGRVQEKVLWLLLLYVFSSTWACPMQIRLSQECCLFCLFCLKSSLWSLDLLCLLAPAILDSFSLFYLPNRSTCPHASKMDFPAIF